MNRNLVHWERDSHPFWEVKGGRKHSKIMENYSKRRSDTIIMYNEKYIFQKRKI